VIANYHDFIARKSHIGGEHGFKPLWMPDWLMDFQACLCDWSIRRGRASLLAAPGLGKTPMQLVFAENVVRKTNKPFLVMTPLAVAAQTAREAEKFGIEAEVSRDGRYRSKIVITNYERLHYFNPNDFAGASCDEASCLKDFNGRRTTAVTEFLKPIPHRLLPTATPSPNDFTELGTLSEALGELGYMEMLGRFMKNDDKTLHIMGIKYGDLTHKKWRFKAHAEEHFWRWVCSWARACRMPSDLGFDDGQFVLPPLVEREHIVHRSTVRPGMLFNLPAVTMDELREERKATVHQRCEMAAELVQHSKTAVAWCHLNPEGDLLEKLIPNAKQVSGSQSDEEKEELLTAFSAGELPYLVTKPKIGAWGLNWQHCSHMTVFPSHSFEQYYQLVRRCWRFGQENEVRVDIVASSGESGVQKNLQRKAVMADRLFSKLVALMNESMQIQRAGYGSASVGVPSWL
jgi:hypothetical protein